MTFRARALLLAFSLLGLGAAGTSSYVHYRLLTQPGFTSFCDVNATVTCTDAYLSQYGSFLGVPVAIGGVLYFALVLLIAGVAGRSSSAARENAPGYIFALSTLALAFVLYLAWASFFALKALCILCAITYVAVVAIFVISGGATSFPMTKLPRRARQDVRTLISSPGPLVVALLFVAGAVAAVVVFPRETSATVKPQQPTALPPVTDAERAKLAEWWEMQPKADVPVPSGDAKVLVVKFNDYQCGACKVTHEMYRDVLARRALSGDVKYVVKHFPLEPECNAGAPGGNHYAACEAAAAVVMARAKGTAAKLEDWIFANIGPPPLSGAQVREAARSIAGVTDFDAQYPNALNEVRADAGLGSLLQVQSTPTFFINGRRLPQLVQPQHLDVLIGLELQRTK